jgi:hypothetical protein
MRGTFAALRARGIYFVRCMVRVKGSILLFPECSGLQNVISRAHSCENTTYIICKPVILECIDIFSCHCNANQLSPSTAESCEQRTSYIVIYPIVSIEFPHITSRGHSQLR